MPRPLAPSHSSPPAEPRLSTPAAVPDPGASGSSRGSSLATLLGTKTTVFGPSPVGARRAYLDLLALLVIASFDSAARAVFVLARIAGTPRYQAVTDTIAAVHLALTVGALVWLSALVTDRTAGAGTGWKTGLRLGAVALGVAAVAGAVPIGSLALYPPAGRAAFAMTLVWLTLEVCRRHGITPARLGILPVWPSASSERTRAAGVGVLALIAVMIGGTGSGILTLFMQAAELPLVPADSQQTALGIISAADAVSSVLRTVVIEDLVMVAAVVALLGAARRPAWEVYAITAAAEVAVHAYLGMPALAFVPYALLRVWLYRHHGLIVPLIAAHLLFNTTAILQWFFTPWQLLVPLAWLALLILAANGIYPRVRGWQNRRRTPDTARVR
ncbi:hypothetical protein [Streptomyces sp. IB2014 016-6]|uniref:hypothetical protein n=1 Tax=Streptomyces sp. IB2014 016-6 TaxID=2517818 RepID=UPI0011CC85CA|nr:hypothetical protein [Streptomyces sp. IB2014 016-6]TXL83950.1 hypothetical protein EW053_35900 [Streptomyces sp. IB2014 016-6]